MKAPKNIARRNRIKKGIRKRITGTASRPRLTVYRSNTAIYAQIVDDAKGLTLASFSSRKKDLLDQAGTRIEKSREVGKRLAAQALAVGVSQVVFDRNGYKYHGIVKSLAEGAREGGLVF
jgi:large subunit ribosomal protein L18